MCGIAGFVDFTKKTDIEILKSMTNVLSHRGPDNSGYSFYNTKLANIGLGHRRLSILDLSPLGNQPMKFEHLEIIYNGEVYNFKEIKRELEAYGYKFMSNTDTEVILKAFHKWGIEAVHKFIGMFAIVIYDKKAQKLFFIRDRAGVKPLYIYYKDDLFLFASELKSFHEHPEFKKSINIDSLILFFRYGYIPQPYSIFQNTWKLKSGHYGILDLKTKEFKEYKYWDIVDFYNRSKLKIDFQEAVEELERLLRSAFKYRLISDVPVGLFLSGGLDSSTVTAILQRETSGKIKTFTIGFFEDEFNEAHYARKIAEYLGTDHEEYYCSEKDACEIIPTLPEVYDEPLADPSTIPTILVSKLAKRKIKVVLSADGGDETFGGYPKYVNALKYHSAFSKLPFKNLLIKALELFDPNHFSITNAFFSKYEKLLEILTANSPVDIMHVLTFFFQERELIKIFNKNNKNDLICFLLDRHNININLYDNIDKMMAIDYKTYLPDDILVKVDRATMSVSLENREPLLDHRIIEFIAQLPSHFKIKNSITKLLLRKVVYKYIPRELIDRPKMGFSPPIMKWNTKLRVLYNELLNNLQDIHIINKEFAKDIILQSQHNSSFAKKVWLLFVFSIWFKKWVN